MILGDPLIKECTICKGLIKEHHLLSGNTCGAVYWTDGKAFMPYLWKTPSVIKCPHCNNLIWNKKLKNIENPSKHWEIKYFDEPTWKDLCLKLRENNFTTKEEIILRKQLLWKLNDRYRYKRNISNPIYKFEALRNKKETNYIDKTGFITYEECKRLNLKALEKELNNSLDKKYLIFLIEIKREMSKFEEAEDILKKYFINDKSPIISTLKKLVKKRNSQIEEIEIKD